MTKTIIIDEGFDYVEKQRDEAARRRKQNWVIPESPPIDIGV